MHPMIKRSGVSFFAILAVMQFYSGMQGSFVGALLAAFVLSLINVSLKPVLLVLTLPINILTLGIFTLFVNAICLWLTDVIVPRFAVNSAFWGAFWISIITLFINTFIVDRRS